MSRRLFHSTLIALSVTATCSSWAIAQISTPSFRQSYTSSMASTRQADESEVVRERFPNGKIHIERQVALDSNGNFVNHGTYQEWNANGDLVLNGQFTFGKRTGTWIKVSATNESPLFSSYPYNKFTAPFQSSVEFVDDQMNGIWVIQDNQNKVVSQVSLEEGQRHGLATFFHPSGEIQFEAEYHRGILNGRFVEKDIKGQIVREDSYVDGQRSIDDKVLFKNANKSVQIEADYLSPKNILVTPDDFFKSQIANYENKGPKVLHGEYRAFFENGHVSTRCHYHKGELNGSFENFFANGQQKSEGEYQNGAQIGKWTWWHENGMRKAVVSYQEGRPTGEILAWNEQGIRVKAANNVATVEAPQVDRQIPVKAPMIQQEPR